MNLRGKIDLLKLNNVWAGKIESKKQPGKKLDVLIIPVSDNDIYQTIDESTGKVKGAYLGLSILERREVGTYGDTHNVKVSTGSAFMEQQPELCKRLRETYIGNMKPLTFDQINQSSTQTLDVQPVDVAADDLPF